MFFDVGYRMRSVGVGALDDPSAEGGSLVDFRKMLRIFRRDVEDAVPYG